MEGEKNITVNVTLTLSQDQVAYLDKMSKANDTNRSHAARMIFRDYMEKNPKPSTRRK